MTLREWLDDFCRSEGRTQQQPVLRRNPRTKGVHWDPSDGYTVTFELAASSEASAEMLVRSKLPGTDAPDLPASVSGTGDRRIARLSFRAPASWTFECARFFERKPPDGVDRGWALDCRGGPPS